VSRFIDEHRGVFGVEFICRTLDVSASAYYQRATGERSARALADERLLAIIRETHTANFEAYGYRRTWKALLRACEQVPRCQVQRLMRAHGIQGAKRRGKPWRTTIADPNATRPADLVERDFSASRPDELWVCDFTRLRCWDGVLYLAFVIDVFSRRVVGWQLATHMRNTLVIDALRMALTQRRRGADVALVVHSDAGSQYTSYDHTQILDDHDVLQSIGSVGDALDNALAVLRLSSFPRSAVFSRHLFRRGRISASGQRGARRSMSGRQDARRNGRRTRPLSAEEKYQIWQQLLTGELTQRQAAEQWNVDPTTIMRIRRIGREGALTALSQSKPGRRDGSGVQDADLAAARAEIARLEETVKEQAIELVALRGKTRSGW
jgi:putative transposase